METIEKVRSRPNPDLQILGVLVTLFDKRTTLSKDVEAHIRKVFGKKAFKTMITRSVRLEESPAHRETIFTFGAHSFRRARIQTAFQGGSASCLRDDYRYYKHASRSHYVEDWRVQTVRRRIIPISQIAPNPGQPRTEIGDLTELTSSIKEKDSRTASG